jgi:AraC family transcriptional regulator, regulatory protein of adaptative response / methylated-DNA-[protein]-cysteine methyltransferase
MSKETTAPASMPSEIAMRHALAARDASFDGAFVYGVVTTGIYCRPSCASRPAKPSNVRFFSDPEAAERAGLRSCKRCKPRATHDQAVERMKTLARYIETHAEEPLSLRKLSARVHISPAHLQRTFKNVLGISPKAFHDAARLCLLKGALKSGKSVLESITEAGFQSTSRVYGHAMRNLGMTPSAYRKGGEGETISYAYRDSALGSLVMAATNRGVCFAQFGSSKETLVKQLREEFPTASIVESSMSDSPELDVWIQAFEVHIAGTGPRPELPLDLRGTAFQVRVWKFLLVVPEGAVVTYGEVAQGIGASTAVRAAASACAANRIAVLVPCHRVLRGDGGLGGYRWGLDRKRALIDAERARLAA